MEMKEWVMMKLGKGYFMLFLLYFVVFRLSCGVVFQMSCVVVSGFRLFIFSLMVFCCLLVVFVISIPSVQFILAALSKSQLMHYF